MKEYKQRHYLKNGDAIRRKAVEGARSYRKKNVVMVRRKDRERYQISTFGKVLETTEDILAYSRDRYRHARIHGYRSGLEVKISNELTAAGIAFEYESIKIKYTRPEKTHTYCPDFVLSNGLIVETKGVMSTEDRQKHLLVLEQHPHLDIRLLFSNSKARIRKGSPTSYGMWCDKNRIKYADKSIPAAWLSEKAPT